MSLYFCCTFFGDRSCLDATFGQFFSLRPQVFCFSLTLYTHSLLKNEFFSECSWVIIEKGTEKEKSSG